MNIPMLKKVRAAILKRPRQFEMSSFFCKSLLFDTDGDRTEPASHCGTAACIAGWAIHIQTGLKTPQQTAEHHKPLASVCPVDYYDEQGAMALGIDINESRKLFYASAWPCRFGDKYYSAKTATARAKIAAARINHFIKTKGRE